MLILSVIFEWVYPNPNHIEWLFLYGVGWGACDAVWQSNIHCKYLTAWTAVPYRKSVPDVWYVERILVRDSLVRDVERILGTDFYRYGTWYGFWYGLELGTVRGTDFGTKIKPYRTK